MPLSLEERIFLVKEVYSHDGKYSEEVQNNFEEKFGEERLPDRHCVVALMKKFGYHKEINKEIALMIS